MNIALLADNLAFGGIGRYCVDLAEGLLAYPDVQCHFLALDSHGNDWLLQEAAAKNLNVEVLSVSAPWKLWRVLRDRRIEILHSQAYRSNLISRLVVRLGNLPVKLVCTAHGVNHFATATAWRTRVWYLADYVTMRTTNKVIAVSAVTQSQIARWIAKERLLVIRNGTVVPPLPNQEDRLTSRQMLQVSPTAKVVCFVGRLSPQKGVATLIEVADNVLRSTTDTYFLIVGDGVMRPQLEKCATEFGRRMLLVGAQLDVRPFYIAADVLLLPSYTEGLPMTLIEAFAHGLPAVASNVGGIPEVVRDGHNGFLCGCGDTAMLSRRLLEVLCDDDLRVRLGANARKTVESDYSISRMVEATYQVYRTLMDQQSR